jgi:CheY-like chemotaxis protein
MPETILLAEDNSQDAAHLLKIFSDARILNPFQVVENGEKAIAYLGGEGIYSERDKYPQPILFLLDLVMPGKTGWDVLTWMIKQPKARMPAVVVLSSVSDPSAPKAVQDFGANIFLSKPFVVEDFLNLLNSLPGVRLISLAKGYELQRAKTENPWKL